MPLMLWETKTDSIFIVKVSEKLRPDVYTWPGYDFIGWLCQWQRKWHIPYTT
jgi:hypothetical protein